MGAKIPRNCLFCHVPLELSSIQQNLQAKGFNGNRPSIWAIQVIKIFDIGNNNVLIKKYIYIWCA